MKKIAKISNIYRVNENGSIYEINSTKYVRTFLESSEVYLILSKELKLIWRWHGKNSSNLKQFVGSAKGNELKKSLGKEYTLLKIDEEEAQINDWELIGLTLEEREDKFKEIITLIKNLHKIYQEITFEKLIEKTGFSQEKLEKIIEDLIVKKELNARILGDLIVFNKDEILTENKSKKRLFGMIRLRGEIDIQKAANFLNILPSEIEALLYDLAGEERIQGKFQGSKFIIGSDVDQFINALDNSFEKWKVFKKDDYKVS